MSIGLRLSVCLPCVPAPVGCAATACHCIYGYSFRDLLISHVLHGNSSKAQLNSVQSLRDEAVAKLEPLARSPGHGPRTVQMAESVSHWRNDIQTQGHMQIRIYIYMFNMLYNEIK